jgi:BED zinc finger
MNKRSDVWNHFESAVHGKARCKLCRVDIGYRGGSTSSLWKHIENKHSHAVMQKLQCRPIAEVNSTGSSPCTVSGMFAKTSITTARSEKVTDLIVRMIAKDTLAISFVEGEGFRELMAYVEPAYQVPCAKTVKRRLKNLHDAAKNKVREFLEQTPTVALTTDCWTSGATENYIALTAHYICQKSFTMASWVLTTQEFEGRHTGVNIREKLQEIMCDWGVQDKTTIMVHDNASNMNLASSLSDKWNPLGCSAHHLNLAVSHSLEKSGINSVVESASRLVSHFKHSALASNSLSKQQDRMNIQRKKLMSHCKTRWNSAFDMLQRLQENRWAVSAVLADVTITKPNIAKGLELTNEVSCKLLP